jgi:ssDNA-binding replication factor A large subunit
MVSAVWESATDQCESAFSNESCDIWTGIGDPNANNEGSFNLYPNPADDHVFISTSGELKRVTVYNALGQLVVDEITTGKQYELPTASYTIGVYMVRVETADGVTTRTLTVQR